MPHDANFDLKKTHKYTRAHIHTHPNYYAFAIVKIAYFIKWYLLDEQLNLYYDFARIDRFTYYPISNKSILDGKVNDFQVFFVLFSHFFFTLVYLNVFTVFFLCVLLILLLHFFFLHFVRFFLAPLPLTSLSLSLTFSVH